MPGGRVHIVKVLGKGLVLAHENLRWYAVWSTINSVAATLTRYCQSDIFVLTIAFSDGRVIIVGGTERIWSSLTTALADHLPGVGAFDDWSSRLTVDSGPEMLYEQQPDQIPRH